MGRGECRGCDHHTVTGGLQGPVSTHGEASTCVSARGMSKKNFIRNSFSLLSQLGRINVLERCSDAKSEDNDEREMTWI